MSARATTNGHDAAFAALLVRLASTPDSEIPASRLGRLRFELEARAAWPAVQAARTPGIGGGWVRVGGFGAGVHRARSARGVWLGPLRVRLLAPDLADVRTGARFVWTGRL